MVLLALALGCQRECRELARIRPEDERVGGVSADEFAAAVADLPPLPLVWSDGATTEVTVTMARVPGTAHRVNWPECVEACHVQNSLMMDCLDELGVQVNATVGTADGRLDAEPFTTEVSAHVDDAGALVWWSSMATIDAGALRGSLALRTLAGDELRTDSADPQLAIWAGGGDASLGLVQLDATATISSGAAAGMADSARIGLAEAP